MPLGLGRRQNMSQTSSEAKKLLLRNCHLYLSVGQAHRIVFGLKHSSLTLYMEAQLIWHC